MATSAWIGVASSVGAGIAEEVASSAGSGVDDHPPLALPGVTSHDER
ncbi:MAG: hypothetical protein H6711_07830 [Myxococcales bacterium]|nr:hypothetical protein [Myxococcales bacterium]